MNRSYSKIRHIQEANVLLESRRLNEASPINQPIGATGYNLIDASGLGKPVCQINIGIQNIKNPADKQNFTTIDQINKLTNVSLKTELVKIFSAKKSELGC